MTENNILIIVAAVSFFLFYFFFYQVKPLGQEINDSIIVEKLISQVEEFLIEGRVSDAANLAIVALSMYDNDEVSAPKC